MTQHWVDLATSFVFEMVERVEFNDLERRVDALEKIVIEIQTLVKLIKPVLAVMVAKLGLDLSQMM